MEREGCPPSCLSLLSERFRIKWVRYNILCVVFHDHFNSCEVSLSILKSALYIKCIIIVIILHSSSGSSIVAPLAGFTAEGTALIQSRNTLYPVRRLTESFLRNWTCLIHIIFFIYHQRAGEMTRAGPPNLPWRRNISQEDGEVLLLNSASQKLPTSCSRLIMTACQEPDWKHIECIIESLSLHFEMLLELNRQTGMATSGFNHTGSGITVWTDFSGTCQHWGFLSGCGSDSEYWGLWLVLCKCEQKCKKNSFWTGNTGIIIGYKMP